MAGRVSVQGRPSDRRALIDANLDYDPDAWLERLPTMDAFGVLIFQVIGQQLSAGVTRTMLRRLLDRFGGQLPTPEQLAGRQPQDLRAAGLSHRKVQTLRKLAERFVDGWPTRPGRAGAAPDGRTHPDRNRRSHCRKELQVA